MDESGHIQKASPRRLYAALLRSFMAGRLTNDQYEDAYDSIEGASSCSACSLVYDAAWFLYDDIKTHRMSGEHQLSPELRRTVARLVLFLRSDYCTSEGCGHFVKSAQSLPASAWSSTSSIWFWGGVLAFVVTLILVPWLGAAFVLTLALLAVLVCFGSHRKDDDAVMASLAPDSIEPFENADDYQLALHAAGYFGRCGVPVDGH